MTDSIPAKPSDLRPSVTAERLRILILDGDHATRATLAEILTEDRFRVSCTDSADAVIREIQEFPYALVIADFSLPSLDPNRFLRDVERASPETVVVALTGRSSVREAVAYTRDGAYDVVTKPFTPDEIELTIEKALKHQELCRYNEELKRKLATSEKLAVIGRLAAGVAHELNSPLDGVLRFVNLSLDRVPEGDSVREYLQEAKTGLIRMADIVRSLLRFSRNIVIENEPKSLLRMVQEATTQVRHANAHSKIAVRTSFTDESLMVPSGIFQVFTNLIKNAFDAIGDRPDGCLRVDAETIDDVVEIRLVDNGCGIPEKDRRKIFEPFFTTKEIGKGTGLGLSICARIVEKFNGTLDLTSDLGVGTTFRIRIPRSR